MRYGNFVAVAAAICVVLLGYGKAVLASDGVGSASYSTARTVRALASGIPLSDSQVACYPNSCFGRGSYHAECRSAREKAERTCADLGPDDSLCKSYQNDAASSCACASECHKASCTSWPPTDPPLSESGVCYKAKWLY